MLLPRVTVIHGGVIHISRINQSNRIQLQILNPFPPFPTVYPTYLRRTPEVDLHPLHYIPTCHVASDICRENPWCQQRLDTFRTTCKFRDGRCRNPDR